MSTTVISMAKAKFELDVCDIKTNETMVTTIKQYLEDCLHGTFDGYDLAYFNRQVRVVTRDDGLIIQVVDNPNGDKPFFYHWRMELVNAANAQYNENYDCALFNPVPMDEYLEGVMNTLHKLLQDNGFVRYEEGVVLPGAYEAEATDTTDEEIEKIADEVAEVAFERPTAKELVKKLDQLMADPNLHTAIDAEDGCENIIGPKDLIEEIEGIATSLFMGLPPFLATLVSNRVHDLDNRFDIWPGDKDSFGWLTGVIDTPKGRIIFG